MAYEEDYILRLVKQMIRALMMVLFNKKEKMDTPADTNAPGGEDGRELLETVSYTHLTLPTNSLV